MRLALPIAAFSVLCLAPAIALAQERVDEVVDLQGVQSDAAATRRSAFGRVMDVMISRLIEQQKTPPAVARNGQHPVTLAPDPALARAPNASHRQPQIDIALGERFALPPADAVTQASLPE